MVLEELGLPTDECIGNKGRKVPLGLYGLWVVM